MRGEGGSSCNRCRPRPLEPIEEADLQTDATLTPISDPITLCVILERETGIVSKACHYLAGFFGVAVLSFLS